MKRFSAILTHLLCLLIMISCATGSNTLPPVADNVEDLSQSTGHMIISALDNAAKEQPLPDNNLKELVFQNLPEEEDNEKIYYLLTPDYNEKKLLVTMAVYLSGKTTLTLRDVVFHHENYDSYHLLTKRDIVGSTVFRSRNDDYILHNRKKDESFSLIYYEVDINASDSVKHAVFNDHTLMITGEELLLFPFYTEDENEGIKMVFSIIPDSEWDYHICNGGLNSVYRTETVDENQFGALSFFSFRKDFFYYQSETIDDDLNLISIINKDIDSTIHQDFVSIFNKLIEIWGGRPPELINYIFFMSPSGNHDAFSEYSHSQFISYRGQNRMSTEITHQLMHIWNAWNYGSAVTGRFNNGFFVEGLTVYYEEVVLNELSLINPGNRLQNIYNAYREIKETELDKPSYENDTDFRIVYFKNALIAYLIDEEIKEQTNNAHSLSSILKRIWANNINEGYSYRFTYNEFFKMISDLGVNITSIIDDYFVNNEPISLSFDEIPRKNIKIDGYGDDWAEINPQNLDKHNENKYYDKYFIAQDQNYIYFRLDPKTTLEKFNQGSHISFYILTRGNPTYSEVHLGSYTSERKSGITHELNRYIDSGDSRQSTWSPLRLGKDYANYNEVLEYKIDKSFFGPLKELNFCITLNDDGDEYVSEWFSFSF